jgi:hypothetical protein
MKNPTPEDLQKAFESNVMWLKRVVPEEAIFALAEQMIMTAEYFMDRWREWVDIEEETSRDSNVALWVDSIVKIQMLRGISSKDLLKEYLKKKGF